MFHFSTNTIPLSEMARHSANMPQDKKLRRRRAQSFLSWWVREVTLFYFFFAAGHWMLIMPHQGEEEEEEGDLHLTMQSKKEGEEKETKTRIEERQQQQQTITTAIPFCPNSRPSSEIIHQCCSIFMFSFLKYRHCRYCKGLFMQGYQRIIKPFKYWEDSTRIFSLYKPTFGLPMGYF